MAQQAQALAMRSHNAALESVARVNSGLALIGLRRKEEGLKLLSEVAQQLRAAGNLESLSHVLQGQAQLLETVGDAAGALKAYRAQQALATEAALHDQQAQVLTLQEQFDATQREHDKRQLIENRALNNEALRRHELELRLWGLSVLLGMLLLPVLWLWYARTRAAQQALTLSTERLRRQSQTDALTGLPNRHHWLHHIQHQPLASGALYLIDLDHFKHINDQYGHAAGDEVLIETAQRLRSVLREQDLVVRWGGEEFLILMPDCGPAQMDVLAQRLLEALAQPPVLTQAGRLAVSGSIGFAAFPLLPQGVALPWEAAIGLVDAVMYLAKQRGRNRACGVHRLALANVAELAQCVQDVAQAWRSGRLELLEWLGPNPERSL
jgi:diguanylate cyclase (GGDEF)-like protein